MFGGSARFVYASMARLAVIKFVHYMNASADVLALASIEVQGTRDHETMRQRNNEAIRPK